MADGFITRRGGGVNVNDATATENDVLQGETFYSGDKDIKTGNMPSKGSETFTPGTTNQTISSGQYLSGTQTILGDADLVSSNIKDGVSIFGINGNFTGDGISIVNPPFILYNNGTLNSGYSTTGAGFTQFNSDSMIIQAGSSTSDGGSFRNVVFDTDLSSYRSLVIDFEYPTVSTQNYARGFIGAGSSVSPGYYNQPQIWNWVYNKTFTGRREVVGFNLLTDFGASGNNIQSHPYLAFYASANNFYFKIYSILLY